MTRASIRGRVKRWAERALFDRPIGRHALVATLRVRARVRVGDVGAATLAWGQRLARRGHPDDAIALYLGAEPHLPAQPRAQVVVQRCALQLRQGSVPADLAVRIDDHLALADRCLADGDGRAAGARLQEAFNLGYHRTMHFEDLPSPLAADPDAFLAPFRRSATFAAVTRPSADVRPLRVIGTTRPRRLLFVSFQNWNFVDAVIADYAAAPGVDVRRVDLRDLPDGPWRAQPVDLVTRRLVPVDVPAAIAEPFEWADVVFVEWGHRALAWTSLLPRLRARVIARIHSYDAFTPMPLHTDWAHIDDVVFVSPHIRAMLTAACPALATGPRLHTIANRNVLTDFRRPKFAEADRTLGMIGWDNVTKDAQWSLDLLEILRTADPRWRLRLVGRPFPRSGITGAAVAYRDELERRLARLGDAVQRPGHTDDVAEGLRHIDVIVSSSRREGTHEGLLQGAASGAFPIVRNWPYVRRWGGAATIVPVTWVDDTPEQAADRLLATPDLAETASATAEWVVKHYDWSVVRPALDALLLDEG
jgi:Glycosyl transferases group 1